MSASPLSHLVALLVILGSLSTQGCFDRKSGEESTNSAEALPPEWRPSLVFYRIPRCFLCDELALEVEALEKKHRSHMNFATLDYHIPSCQEAIKQHGLGSHGIVITDYEGTKLWSLSDHESPAVPLEEAVRQILNP